MVNFEHRGRIPVLAPLDLNARSLRHSHCGRLLRLLRRFLLLLLLRVYHRLILVVIIALRRRLLLPRRRPRLGKRDRRLAGRVERADVLIAQPSLEPASDRVDALIAGGVPARSEQRQAVDHLVLLLLRAITAVRRRPRLGTGNRRLVRGFEVSDVVSADSRLERAVRMKPDALIAAGVVAREQQLEAIDHLHLVLHHLRRRSRFGISDRCLTSDVEDADLLIVHPGLEPAALLVHALVPGEIGRAHQLDAIDDLVPVRPRQTGLVLRIASPPFASADA